AAGFEVRVIDAAARHFQGDDDDILATIESFGPDVVGVGLFTRWIWHAYRIVDRLKGTGPLLVAGGAHTTVRPEETLRHGFDVAVVGEAEETFVALVRAHTSGASLGDIPGLVLPGDTGPVRTKPAGFLGDLDALAFPQTAQHLFDPAWYHPDGRTIVPGGLLTSRGCPARCTFCANYVTGRGFRYRSDENVAAELQAHHDAFGSRFFPFWDDALTAHRRRLEGLCEAIGALSFNPRWSAITRASMVTPQLLATMRDAGLVHVNFGVESGDDRILKVIKKGVTTQQVEDALRMAKDAGLKTAANFMLGFPQEGPTELRNTLRFMKRIAPLVDTFSTLGVAVPFPGTPLYEDHVERFGFADWWLDEAYSRYTEAPPIADREAFRRYYVDDANLDLDFFGYDDATRAAIRECLVFKAEHNLAQMGLLDDPVFAPDPLPAPAASA
ncbi:MAG: B12-binding domain-containing radical SAM protein, partial [Deltaproteobacteria bacterium]|nr:B12-binding domain-containing radical SAM protein [Deltaproteobacteria bacterium]